jgi:formylmethanofuran dehydrogenase subunit A
MSTDHPNGGSFVAYPEIISLLMSRDRRADALKRLHEKVRARSGLADLSREYSLSEIAIITRSGPAKILGLASKGHLGLGADGDVTIYAPNDDHVAMFSMPRFVIKGGHIVIDDGAIRSTPEGKTIGTSRPYDQAIVPDVQSWFDANSSIRFANFTRRDVPLEGDAR